jgi:hypothetical protein
MHEHALPWRPILVLTLAVAALGGCDDDPSGTGAAGGGGAAGTSTSTTTSSTTGTAGTGGGGGDMGLSDEVERCLFVNACEADGGSPMGMQACLGHFYEKQWRWASSGSFRLQMEAMDCRLAATDCAAVRACDATPADFDTACAEAAGQTLCVDDTWVICDAEGHASDAFDCSAAGQSCNVDVWAGCGTEACTFGSPSSCDPDDPNVLVLCSPAGFIDRVDCSRENNFVLINSPDGELRATIAGETCGDDPMLGSKGCIGTGAPCDFFSQECQEDTLVTCAGGALASRDCAAQEPPGQSCGYVPEGLFAGGAACGVVESACDPAAADSCEGGAISFCAQGLAQTVSCADAGFAGCAEGTANGKTIAYCTM